MLVKYLITRPSAALFLNHIFALSLCSCVVLVEVFLEGDVRTSARGRTLLREIEWRSKGNPFGN